MREGIQFSMGLVIGLFIWKFYDVIHMAIGDGLAYFGVNDPYIQGFVILAILGFVIFVIIHGGSRHVMNKIGI